MGEEQKVSLVVAVYKSENFLDRLINSMINQTYKNIEIILVDDGSPDNSGEICDKYAERDSRIKVIHQEPVQPEIQGLQTLQEAGSP